jgi:phosphopantetheine--protein transferase-like protein
VIAGIGLDVVDVNAFAGLLNEPGTVFAERTFTPAERRAAVARAAAGSQRPELHLAARYAAKEAAIKALSQALAPAALPKALADLREIEVVSDADGRPSLVLTGRVQGLAAQGGVRALHVSLSHEAGLATAMVVAER